MPRPVPITVLLDPDGTHDVGHYVLVLAETGVRYETQCAGLLTEIRGGEGFLVSVGPHREAAIMSEWVMCRYQDYGQAPAISWSANHIVELRSVVGSVLIYGGEDESPVALILDESRLAECVEAWIPVLTPYGAAWFLGANSD